MSKRIHEEHRKKYELIEKAENEKRLATLSLLDERNNVKPKIPIKAEFMPPPGTIPLQHKEGRNAFVHSDQCNMFINEAVNGLWGGKFRVTMEKAKRLKVLNLFDISMELQHAEPETESEYDDDSL
jgi:hypothetical protein